MQCLFVCLFVESDLEQSHNKSGRKTQEQFRITLNVSEITEKNPQTNKTDPTSQGNKDVEVNMRSHLTCPVWLK